MPPLDAIQAMLTAAELDAILALQLTIAWAGEGAGDPPRLGWWRSDLVDKEGGGDLLGRLLPRTAAWASLVLVRQAARRVDEAARAQLPHGGDKVWSLFHFGFRVDEALDDRIEWHRRDRHAPSEVLGPSFLAHSAWNQGGFEALLGGFGKPKVEITSAGRKLTAPVGTPHAAARLLAAALMPLPASYPLPFVERTP